MKSKKPALESIQFFLVSLMLILSGFQHGNYPVIGILLISLGTFLIGYALYIRITRRRNPVLKIFALCGEFVALLAASYILYRNGSNYLHMLYLLAAVGIAVAIGVHVFNIIKHKDKPINLNTRHKKTRSL